MLLEYGQLEKGKRYEVVFAKSREVVGTEFLFQDSREQVNQFINFCDIRSCKFKEICLK